MLQTLVILSLSYWIVEEYLNNMYLREYISGVFQTEGWMFGILATLLVFGSATGLFVKHRHGQGTISLEVKNPSPVASPSKVEKKPETDFHPLVAALKADMADRRASFGSMVGSGAEQPTTVPAPRPEVQKTSVLEQLTPTRQAPMTGPMPEQTRATYPQRPLPVPGPQARTTPGAEQLGAPLTQRPMPYPRPQQPAGSNVLQTAQPPPPQLPLKITTVITGIMPASRKKDPAQSPEEKPSSSQ
jgi:hypothetical protein